MKNLLLILILIFCSTFLFSQTTIPGGPVSGTWLQSGSPYLVEGEIEIPNGETLTIDPGCLIEFQGHYKLNVQGRLLAIGTEQDSICFTALDSDIGWCGIRFDYTPSTNDLSIISYAKLINANYYNGGALRCSNFSNLVISNCLISNNKATGIGGGLCITFSNIIIENSIIENNIALSQPSPQGNQPGNGGGIYCAASELVLENCIFRDNIAETGEWSSGGGAIISGSSEIIINNCLFYGNIAEEGGAIFSSSSNITLYNSIVIDGYASENLSNLEAINSIFWSNGPYNIYFSTWNPGSASISYSCFNDGINSIYANGGLVNWLEGNIEDDPLFIDPENGNYHFLSNSPCINAGTPDTTGLNLPEYDLDGNPRIYEDRIDMGCYEWQGTEADYIQLPMISYQLSNYPNPFNPETTISFSIAGSEDNKQKVSISVFNIRGQKVKTLIDKTMIPGRYSVIWDSKDQNGKPVSSGIYFYQLEVDGKMIKSRKMLLLK